MGKGVSQFVYTIIMGRASLSPIFYTMNKYIYKIKNIAITGCVHGDEIIGKKVINVIKHYHFPACKVSGIIANKPAMRLKKRFVKYDLNRIFPGKKNGRAEEKIAHHLKNNLSKYDLCIDLHATNSYFESLIIITRFNKQIKELLKYIPIKNVALMTNHKLSKGSLIHNTKLGICLEYGKGKNGKNYPKAVNDIKILINNIKKLGVSKKIYRAKNLYKVYSIYKVADKFTQNKNLRDFVKIQKGQLIGHKGNQKIFSTTSFYPLFLGKGRYESTLALMAEKENITL